MVHVSRYSELFSEAFDKAFGELPDKYPEMVKKICDQIHEQVTDRIRDDVVDYLAESIKDDIKAKAQAEAEGILINALAGDDKTIMSLFGFNEWYRRNVWLDKLPKEWALIDAIVKRNPELFMNEKLSQQETEISALRKEKERLKEYADHWRKKYEGEI